MRLRAESEDQESGRIVPFKKMVMDNPTNFDVIQAVSAQIENAYFRPNVAFMHYHDYVNSNICRRLPRKLKKRLKLQSILK